MDGKYIYPIDITEIEITRKFNDENGYTIIRGTSFERLPITLIIGQALPGMIISGKSIVLTINTDKKQTE